MCVLIMLEHFLPFHLIYSFVREKSGEKPFTTSAPFFSLTGGGEEGEKKRTKTLVQAVQLIVFLALRSIYWWM